MRYTPGCLVRFSFASSSGLEDVGFGEVKDAFRDAFRRCSRGLVYVDFQRVGVPVRARREGPRGREGGQTGST